MTIQQLDLFSTPSMGELKRDAGMIRAEEHANRVIFSWSEQAFSFLSTYISTHPYGFEFMTEDVRGSSRDIVPNPPSQRAWGAVIIRAAKSGLIRCTGFRKVKNSNAHCTPASVWKIVKS